ncbi:3'-5' exonuclease [Marinobacterium lutimaris]|uniref:3'-5' exoribonuclease Rv2179c-like domain-containing protein n=1 Tax=Marinobacterium lutimaris TaxID=568106 RepID=A0A1H5XPK5_9GAMM|nr:3'-5' exonuclease [Marinobacterium lutimaris]SEG13573.1 protein of unknown function [Marinobacterium lutimaris]
MSFLNPTTWPLFAKKPRTEVAKPYYPYIMIDGETAGTGPTSALFSIGAVAYNPMTGEVDIDNAFCSNIDLQSCIDAGLTIDGEAIYWWLERSTEARAGICEATTTTEIDENGTRRQHTKRYSLLEVLTDFSDWMAPYNAEYCRINKPRHEGVASAMAWSNGADFDLPILANAYRAIGHAKPWAAFQGRCYRTDKSAGWGIKMERTGTHHNALDDAISQAQHHIDIVNELRSARRALAQQRLQTPVIKEVAKS